MDLHSPAHILGPVPMCAFPWPPGLCLINRGLSSYPLVSPALWVWMFCTACCSEAHSACFVSCRSLLFDVRFPDVSYYFLRGASCGFWACKLWASSPLTDIKQERCHSVLSVCLCLLFFLSLSIFPRNMSCVQLSCVQCTTPTPSSPPGMLLHDSD